MLTGGLLLALISAALGEFGRFHAAAVTRGVWIALIYLIVYGSLFLVVILLMPRGIVPSASHWLRSWRAQRADRRLVRARPGRESALNSHRYQRHTRSFG